MLYLSIFLLFLAIFLFRESSRRRKVAGLPGGKIIYSDTSTWDSVQRPLYDNDLDLSGKPDYLISQNDLIIPVEVKSSRISQAPYDSHIFQLAAYCRLVHAEYGARPTHGILRYSNRTFKIDYTHELESELLDLINEMKSRKQRNRSHSSPQRCFRCGFQSNCDQRLN